MKSTGSSASRRTTLFASSRTGVSTHNAELPVRAYSTYWSIAARLSTTAPMIRLPSLRFDRNSFVVGQDLLGGVEAQIGVGEPVRSASVARAGLAGGVVAEHRDDDPVHVDDRRSRCRSTIGLPERPPIVRLSHGVSSIARPGHGSAVQSSATARGASTRRPSSRRSNDRMASAAARLRSEESTTYSPARRAAP